MFFRLNKMSTPGWEKNFETETEVAQHLLKYICRSCRGTKDEVPSEENDGSAYGSENVHDLLNTPCGCVFWLEEIPDANDY